jgi:hypothetical protein
MSCLLCEWPDREGLLEEAITKKGPENQKEQTQEEDL